MPEPRPASPRPPGFASFAFLRRLPVRLLSAAIWLYQRTLSPALVALNPTCGCRFAPTCSHYAQLALEEHGLLRGIALTVVRLAKCGPWHPGGLDPVPARPTPRCVRVSTPAATSSFALPTAGRSNAALPSS